MSNVNNPSNRRSSTIRRNRSRSRALTEGVQNVGILLSNLASRFARQFTRRNRDHLVIPINESPRSSKSSKSSSSRSSKSSKSSSSRSSKSSSSRKNKPNSIDLIDIDTALGLKKQFLQLRKVRSVKKRK
jgi:hypothetical protein